MSVKRPPTVNLALLVLALNIGASYAHEAVRRDWTGYGGLAFSFEVLLLAVPLWLAFLGWNWGRWLLAISVIGGMGLGIHWSVARAGQVSNWRIVAFWLRSFIDVVAVVVLFMPSSSRWYRANAESANQQVQATPDGAVSSAPRSEPGAGGA